MPCIFMDPPWTHRKGECYTVCKYSKFISLNTHNALASSARRSWRYYEKKENRGVLAAAGAAAVLSGLCTGRAFCLDMESYAGLLDKERMSGETEYMVSGDQECRRLLMELVSAGAGKEREEFFITGEDYEPETLVIAQMFPAAVNISNTKIEEYEENGRRYVTCRIGFERQPDQEACTHRWETRILEPGPVSGEERRN